MSNEIFEGKKYYSDRSIAVDVSLIQREISSAFPRLNFFITDLTDNTIFIDIDDIKYNDGDIINSDGKITEYGKSIVYGIMAKCLDYDKIEYHGKIAIDNKKFGVSIYIKGDFCIDEKMFLKMQDEKYAW